MEGKTYNQKITAAHRDTAPFTDQRDTSVEGTQANLDPLGSAVLLFVMSML